MEQDTVKNWTDTIKNWKVIDLDDFNQLVLETYGKPYNLQQQGDMYGQESIVGVTVKKDINYFEDWSAFEDWIDDTWKPSTKQFHAELDEWEYIRDHYPPLELLGVDLAAKGVLPEGDYHIWIWW